MGPPSDQGVAARSSTGRDGWTMTGQVPVVTQDLAWKAGDRESAGNGRFGSDTVLSQTGTATRLVGRNMSLT